MPKSLVLNVGSELGLLKIRSAVLRRRWNVVDALVGDALRVMAEHDLDAIVICSSVREPERSSLVREVLERSASLNLVLVGDSWACANRRVHCVPHFDPEEMNDAVEEAVRLAGRPQRAA